MKDLNFIILLLLFFGYYGKIRNWEYYLINDIETIEPFEESIYLKVSFQRIITKPYNGLNIQFENNKKDDSGYLAFYSKYDKDCMPYRQQMNINPYGNNLMSINRNILIEYYEEEDSWRYDYYNESFYLCVYCLNELSCNYKITFEFNNYINMPNNINFFNYVSHETKKNFIFSFESDYNINDNINENNNIYEL